MTADPAGERPFTVKIASTGKTYHVQAGISVVDALAAHGIHIPTMCTHGLCGTCTTGVIAGIPDHRDYHLTREEQESNAVFTPCCSRAKTSVLVLDL